MKRDGNPLERDGVLGRVGEAAAECVTGKELEVGPHLRDRDDVAGRRTRRLRCLRAEESGKSDRDHCRETTHEILL